MRHPSGTNLDPARARCPFFRRSTNNSIICEGIVERSTMQWRFGRTQDRDLQFSVFCCKKFENCELHKAVLEKYQDG